MKTNHYIFLIILGSSLLLFSCGKEWLEVRPENTVDQYSLANMEGIEAILAGAYSMLDGVSSQFGWESASSNWLYGSIRGIEANKGTDAGDSWAGQSIVHYWETATNEFLNQKWREVYEAVSRSNCVIMVTKQALADGTISQDQAELFLQQARALRGWYHFEAWRMWNMIPYVDENTDQNKLKYGRYPGKNN